MNAQKHPDYGHWLETWGKMHAADENRAWLAREMAARCVYCNCGHQQTYRAALVSCEKCGILPTGM